MIVVAGWARTGTSIMFQCLQESGLYGGGVGELSGFKYKTEHIAFRVANFLVMMHCGFKPLINPKYSDETFQIIDLFDSIPEKQQELPYFVKEEMYKFLLLVKERGINLLKDPQAAFAIDKWLSVSKTFSEAKYIWMRRDLRKAAKSFVRLKVPRIPQYRGVLTTKKAEKIYTLHEKMWDLSLSKLPKDQVLTLWLEDLIENTEKVTTEVEEFIGRPFDTRLITQKETWAGGQKFFVEKKEIQKDDFKSVALMFNPITGRIDERKVAVGSKN